MKHMNEEITWEDALLQLEQVKDGRLPPKDTPTLANPLYIRAYDKFLHHGTMTNTLREGSDSEGGYKRGWERICRTINMHGATAHVLRHTYHDGCSASGHQTLQTIAGHSDISTTMNRYAHGREDKIIQAGGLLRDMYG